MAEREPYVITASDRQIMHQMRRWMRNVRGKGRVKLFNSDDGLLIVVDDPYTPPKIERQNYIWAKLGASTPIPGSSNQWFYAFSQVIPSAVDPSGWTAPTSPITDVTFGNQASNGFEANNMATGVQGNGVNVNNLPGSFKLVPLGTGAIVQMFLLQNSDATTPTDAPAPWFFAPNQIDGSCTSGSGGS